jgi:hypothetical protein
MDELLQASLGDLWGIENCDETAGRQGEYIPSIPVAGEG